MYIKKVICSIIIFIFVISILSYYSVLHSAYSWSFVVEHLYTYVLFI